MTAEPLTTAWRDLATTIDWSDLRGAHAICRRMLSSIAADRAALAELIQSIPADPARMAQSECHPLMTRLVLYDDPGRDVQIRLHLVPAVQDLVPHDHKYSFTVYVLSGGYVHVWRRRTGAVSGEFTSQDVVPALVAVETPGSCYTFGYSLVHQTVMAPGTVTLFMRGPKAQPRWHAARDMYHLVSEYDAPPADGGGHRGGVRLSTGQFEDACAELVRRGIIDDPRSQRAF